jgi:hypothetical protein
MDLINNFEKSLNAALTDNQVLGPDAAKARASVMNNVKELREEDIDYEPLKFLKKESSILEILKLVKNKKLSNTKIRQEIKKHLKDPEQLNEFLNSILNSRGKKEENKEAMSTGGMSGTFEPPLSLGNTKKIETKEATSAGAGVGAYETPKAWAKSTSKKDWRGKSKTQIPGGKFVQVKKKCKRFPYCNQGDIKALNIFENETLKTTIKKMSMKYNLGEDVIKEIILKEIKINKNL